MARNLRRYKNKDPYPKKPKSIVEVKKAFEDPVTVQKFGRNLRDTERFYIDTIIMERMTKDGIKESFFTIFASYEILNMIAVHIPLEQRIWMLDGTFAVTPIDGGYYQLLIIHIQYKNDVSDWNRWFSTESPIDYFFTD